MKAELLSKQKTTGGQIGSKKTGKGVTKKPVWGTLFTALVTPFSALPDTEIDCLK